MNLNIGEIYFNLLKRRVILLLCLPCSLGIGMCDKKLILACYKLAMKYYKPKVCYGPTSKAGRDKCSNFTEFGHGQKVCGMKYPSEYLSRG